MNPSEWMQEKDTVDSFTEYGCVAEPECEDYAEEVLTVKSEGTPVESKWTYRLELKEGVGDYHWMKIYRDGYQVATGMFSFKWTAKRWARKRIKQLQRGPRVIEGEF